MCVAKTRKNISVFYRTSYRLTDLRTYGYWDECNLQEPGACLKYYGGLAPGIVGEHVPMSGGSWAYVTKEPYGVVGGVGAWNYPLQTCTWKGRARREKLVNLSSS